MKRKICGVKMRCPHCNKYFEVIMPTPPSLVESQTEEDEQHRKAEEVEDRVRINICQEEEE